MIKNAIAPLVILGLAFGVYFSFLNQPFNEDVAQGYRINGNIRCMDPKDIKYEFRAKLNFDANTGSKRTNSLVDAIIYSLNKTSNFNNNAPNNRNDEGRYCLLEMSYSKDSGEIIIRTDDSKRLFTLRDLALFTHIDRAYISGEDIYSHLAQNFSDVPTAIKSTSNQAEFKNIYDAAEFISSKFDDEIDGFRPFDIFDGVKINGELSESLYDTVIQKDEEMRISYFVNGGEAEFESRINDRTRLVDILLLSNVIKRDATKIDSCIAKLVYSSLDGSLYSLLVTMGFSPAFLGDTPLGLNLSKDPVNKDEYQYILKCDPTNKDFEININLGSEKIREREVDDTGNDPELFEYGTRLDLL